MYAFAVIYCTICRKSNNNLVEFAIKQLLCFWNSLSFLDLRGIVTTAHAKRMGRLKLYGNDMSTSVWSVRLALAELRLRYEYVVVDHLRQENLAEFYRKHLDKEEIMLEDDDDCVWDSNVILCYIGNKYGLDNTIYSKDPLKRAIVDQRLHFESRLFVTFSMIFRENPALDRKNSFFEVTYDKLESFLRDTDYMASNQLTIADFSLIAPMSSLIGFCPLDPVKYAKLVAWIRRMQSLPYFREHLPRDAIVAAEERLQGN